MLNINKTKPYHEVGASANIYIILFVELDKFKQEEQSQEQSINKKLTMLVFTKHLFNFSITLL